MQTEVCDPPHKNWNADFSPQIVQTEVCDPPHENRNADLSPQIVQTEVCDPSHENWNADFSPQIVQTEVCDPPHENWNADFSPQIVQTEVCDPGNQAMEWSTSPHRPPHLYVDGMWYFITASTVKGAHILATDKHFDLWTQALRELTKEFKIKMASWLALPNHYHLLFLPKSGWDIGSFMKRLNGRTSREFNLLDNTLGRSVWYTYWDTCIRDERGFWTRFNYIHYNPVKHGYVQQPQDWHYSSYRFYLREEGENWLADCWAQFSPGELLENDKF